MEAHSSHHGTIRFVSWASAILVALLAVAAFGLSFHALRELATLHGYASGTGWVFPLVIDGAIVVFSMAALRGQLRGLKARYEMMLVLAATAASSAFNICHAPEDILSRIMAVVPPLVLFLAFEVLIRQLRSELHDSAPESDGPNDEISTRQKRSFPRAKLAHEPVQDFTLNQSANGSELAGETARPRKQSKRSQISRRRSKIATLQDRGLAIADISKAVGASAATVRRDLSILGQS